MGKDKVSAARWLAFEILRRVDDGGFSSVLLANEEPKLKPSDRALCHELVLGVLRRQLTLDKLVEHYSHRKIASIDRDALIALRLGLYQLRFLARIPASAAVDESVKLVQAARLSSARSFVNAVLRRATREPDYNPAKAATDPISKIAIETSHPAWLLERWANYIGIEETEALARANNETPSIAFRIVNAENENHVLAKLEAAGTHIEKSKIAQAGWRATSGSDVLRQLAENHEIYFQAEASQLVAELVEARSDELVLDLCSAPGGKTAIIAGSVREGVVVAADISPRRLATVAAVVEAQQLKNVSLLLLNASQLLPFRVEAFDRILVDAPCSGTGTLRHNPEIRWRISADDIQRLGSQQVWFLQNAAAALKRGGRLIYSTCSVEKEENEDVVAEFLSNNREFRQIPFKTPSSLTTASGAVRTWPHRNETDGFFVAAFQKG